MAASEGAPAGERRDAADVGSSLPRRVSEAASTGKGRGDFLQAGQQRKVTLLVLLGEEVAEDTPPTLTAPASPSKVVFPRLKQYLQQRYSDSVQVIAGSTLQSFTSPRHPEALQNADALFLLDDDFKTFSEVLRRAGPQLRWIHSYRAGVSSLCAIMRDTPWPGHPTQAWGSQPHVLVTNGRTVFSPALAEYALGAMLHFYKRIPELQKYQKACSWVLLPMPQLRGKTLGLLGFGDIGRECALLAKAFGMKCTALRSGRRTVSDDRIVLERVWTQNSGDRLEFFRSADVIICSLPATRETEKFVGRAEFAAMKKSCIFISIGRGCVVDEEELLKAVQTQSISGAALDVFRQEPLPADSPLWKEDRILISSHCCDCEEDHCAPATIKVFDENLRRFLEGAINNSDMFTPVDVQLGY